MALGTVHFSRRIVGRVAGLEVCGMYQRKDRLTPFSQHKRLRSILPDYVTRNLSVKDLPD